jgi:hypothetical protein
MWNELIWNVDFLRGLIHIAIGVLAAIIVVPWILKRLQEQRDKRLAKALLRKWGNICISAISALKPDTEKEQEERWELMKSGDWDLSGYVSTDQSMYNLWEDIRKGKRNPGGSAMIISAAIEKVIYSDEERKNKELPPEKIYQLNRSLAVDRSWIRRILNPMYAKIEIFDIELLPIGELEMAMSYLDSFSQQGHFTRNQFMVYNLHLAQSMEKFAKHLWNLENWSNKYKKKVS